MNRLAFGAAVLLSAVTLDAQQIPPSNYVIGVGNFIHAVADVEQSVAFYRDALGMEVQVAPNAPPAPGPRPFIATPEILRLYDSVGAQYRTGTTLVQGSPMRAELVEFKNIERKPAKRSLQDPGAAIMVLNVRDIDAALTQARFKGATIVTESGMPVSIKDEHGTGRAVLLQDPDGFFVQLIQRERPVAADAPAGNVIDVSFAVIVDDMDRTLHVFRDVLGFKATLDPQDHDDARLAMLGVFTAFYRRAVAIVPGTAFEVEFIEIHGLNRRHVRSRPRDPGSAILRLRVADVDSTIKALDMAGVKVASTEGMPVTVVGAANTQRYAMMQTADNFFVQIVQQIPNQPKTN
jgi:catechol 2,3-dioxygenase-like lactoylglutathione lyase family enzyme